MTTNAKPASGGTGDGQAGDNGKSLPEDKYSIPHPVAQAKNHARFNQLMSFASQQMELHVDDYGTHFLIWLSCYCAKNGIPWGAQT